MMSDSRKFEIGYAGSDWDHRKAYGVLNLTFMREPREKDATTGSGDMLADLSHKLHH